MIVVGFTIVAHNIGAVRKIVVFLRHDTIVCVCASRSRAISAFATVRACTDRGIPEAGQRVKAYLYHLCSSVVWALKDRRERYMYISCHEHLTHVPTFDFRNSALR